nr:polysaccharide biosynthesis/export family protein [uncultured Roseococcus sp.]
MSSDSASSGYYVVDIDESVINTLHRLAPPSFSGQFDDHRPVNAQRLGVGDVLAVTVWEAAGGGLFSAPISDRAASGARSAVIPEQQVGQDGAITVPFAGRIQVVGRTADAVERLIVQRLQGQAIQPQALVTVTRNLSSTATVLGEVTTGGRLALTTRGDRLLDVIASAGGIRTPPHETFVRLSRDGQSTAIPLQSLLQRPRENIIVRPGDTITVVRQPQTFVSVGATGRNALIPFEAMGISLLEAVGSAGGLIDSRADPAGVYVLRQEPLTVAKAIGAPDSITSADATTRVVYRLNLSEPAALFHGREFMMRDKDVLYVASAALNELQKVLQIFNLVVQPVVTGATISNAVGR